MVKKGEFFYFFILGESGGQAFDLTFIKIYNSWVCAIFGRCFDFQAFDLGIRRQHFKIGNDQRGRKLSLVADKYYLTDKPRSDDHLLDVSRSNIFSAGGFEQFFFAVGDL